MEVAGAVIKRMNRYRLTNPAKQLQTELDQAGTNPPYIRYNVREGVKTFSGGCGVNPSLRRVRWLVTWYGIAKVSRTCYIPALYEQTSNSMVWMARACMMADN